MLFALERYLNRLSVRPFYIGGFLTYRECIFYLLFIFKCNTYYILYIIKISYIILYIIFII